MDMLRNMEAKAEEDSRMQWIMYLYPVRSTASSSDGTQFCGAVDIEQTLQRLDGALSIIQNARKQALHTGHEATTTGATQHNVTLTKEQMSKAHQWLRVECFEAKYMHNEELKSRIARYEANHKSLTPKLSRKLKDDRRGAFKSWKFNLLGNAALFNTVLSCGIFEAGDQRRFLLAYLEQLEQKSEPNVSKEEKEQRRINAKEARQTLRGAMELSANVYRRNFTQDEELLLAALHAGHLQSECKETARLVQEATPAHQYTSMRAAAKFRMHTIRMQESMTGWQPVVINRSTSQW